MLSGKSPSIQWKKQGRGNSIEHKMSATLFVLLILFTVFAGFICAFFYRFMQYPGLVIAIVISVASALFLGKKTAMLVSFKFVDQVNNITGTARAISNSYDLSQRVESSSRPDELGQLEAALNEMLQQMEVLFEKQKRFVADASHELRTPITVLNGYLDILEWGRNDPVLMEESIAAMKEEMQNMKKLSENLLLLSRLEQDELNLEWETIDLSEFVDKLVKDTRIIAGDRKVKYKRGQSVLVKGDYFLLLQMLRAVVENSIKYTREDGCIDIILRQEGDDAVIEIADNGVGIPEKDCDRIFERFYRVDKSRDRAKGGTGLGLSLVKQIADLHGGTVKASSTAGQGTTVSFTLPEAMRI